MPRYRHTHSGERRGDKVQNCCVQGVSRLMNVCSVLINTLDYLNPPSELRPVTRTEGYERSKINAPPTPTPSSLLKHSLLIKLLSLPFLCVPAPIQPPVCRSFVALSLLLLCSS